MIGNIKRKFPPKTGLQEKQLLQDPVYVKDVGDALLHAAWSLQNTRRFSSFNYFDCIALNLFYFMSKTSEMCTMATNYNVNSN